MAWHRLDSKREYQKTERFVSQPENPSGHFGLDICLIFFAGAFFYAVFHLNDSMPDFLDMLRSHIPEGLAVGTFIGLNRYYRRRENKAEQLQEEKELAEQKKAEECGYRNYRSSGL